MVEPEHGVGVEQRTTTFGVGVGVGIWFELTFGVQVGVGVVHPHEGTTTFGLRWGGHPREGTFDSARFGLVFFSQPNRMFLHAGV